MIFQFLPVHKVLDDIAPLVAKHYEEAEKDDEPKPSPDWAQYKALGEAGVCWVMTLWDSGELVGYALFMIFKSLHYGQKKAADDGVFILPEYRGRATVEMLDRAEAELKKLGVTQIMTSQRREKLKRLFRLRGFKETHTVLSKEL